MRIFWVNIEVKLKNKFPILSGESKEPSGYVEGFYQEIGCTADHIEELKTIITEYLLEFEWIDSSEVDIIFDRIGEIEPIEIQSEIYDDLDIRDSLKANPQKKGIWYTSGRGFYHNDDEDEDFYEVAIVKY